MSHPTDNLLEDEATKFVTSTMVWTVVNGSAARGIGFGPYSTSFTGTDSDKNGNVMFLTADGGGAITATSPSITVTGGKSYLYKAVFATDMYAPSQPSVRLEIQWYDAVGVELNAGQGYIDVDLTNAIDPLSNNSAPKWYVVHQIAPAPSGAVSANVLITCDDGPVPGSGSGITSGFRFAVFDPSVQLLGDSVSAYTNTIYNKLPGYVRSDDSKATTHLPLYKYLSSLCVEASKIADAAESFEYIRPTDAADGIGQTSKLVDPYTMDVDVMPWLASLLGVKLTGSTAQFTPWSALMAYDGPDGGAIAGQWDDWEDLSLWSDIEGFGVGFVDPAESYRDQLATGVSGIHAGRVDTIIEYAKTLLNSTDPANEFVGVKKRDRDSSHLIEIDIDAAADPDPAGIKVENALSVGMPAGVELTVNSTNTPVAHSSALRYVLGDVDFAIGAGGANHEAGPSEWAAQGIVNVEGGSATASLMDATLHTDPLLGGIIGEAAFANGKALFAGNLVSAETATSSTLDPVNDYDIFVCMTHVTAPTDADGSGTETGTPARLIASGNNWSLHMTKPDVNRESNLSLVHNGTGSGSETVTSTASANFENLSRNHHPVCIRVQKIGEVVRFYVQDSLYDDWTQNQLGADVSLTSGNGSLVSAGASALVTILEDTTPGSGTNTYDMSLSCAVHRFILATGSNLGDPTFLESTGGVPNEWTLSTHGLAVNDLVEFVAVGTGATGYAINTPYYVASVPTANTFQLSATKGGSPIAGTGDSGSIWTISKGGWSPEPNDSYDYSSANASVVLDVDFVTNASSNYTTSITPSVGPAITINDNGGDNTNNMYGLVQSATSGDTFYFGAAPLAFGGPATSGDTLTALVPNNTYDWKMTYVDPTDDATPLTQTVTSVTTTGGTGITWDSDTYGDRAIIKLEVVLNSSGVFDSGNDEALLLPSTIQPNGQTQEGVSSHVDTATNGPTTWELDRVYYAGEYMPSQVIDRNILHLQNGVMTIEKPPELDINLCISYSFLIRTHHSNAAQDYIMRHLDGSGNGISIWFNGTAVEASITDGTRTVGPVSWDIASDQRVGYWNLVCVTYGPSEGLQVHGNGFLKDTASAAGASQLRDRLDTNTDITLGMTGNPKDFALGMFSVFRRCLTLEECLVMADELDLVPTGNASAAFGYNGTALGTVV